ncbi:hypothetical protein HK104_007477, partial [Borealophlyctis nickersoniae]
WWMAGMYIWRNRGKVGVAVLVPTAYLWWVDHVALAAGVWRIDEGTSTGWMVTRFLPVEEAVFFLVTNCMVVFGTCAAYRTFAVVRIQTVYEPSLKGKLKAFPAVNSAPSSSHPLGVLGTYVRAILTPDSSLPQSTLTDLHTALTLLTLHSRSFSLAARLFPNPIRDTITALYSFCRITDDIADDPLTPPSIRTDRLTLLRTFVDAAYIHGPNLDWTPYTHFPPQQLAALRIFTTLVPPTVPHHTLHELLTGCTRDQTLPASPLHTKDDLITYCENVASSVGEACVSIIMRSTDPHWDPHTRESEKLIRRARDMGVALQLVNMARDVGTDAEEVGRWYGIDEWVSEVCGVGCEEGVDEERKEVLNNPWKDTRKLRAFAEKFLDASEPYAVLAEVGARMLPEGCRRTVEAALHIYMGIGDEIRKAETYPRRAATSKWKKLAILVRTMYLA